MCTNIENIDWSKMPEGAVEFSLKNHIFPITWYNEDKELWIHAITRWQEDICPDDRTKYKVADYRPSMKQDKQKFTPVIGQPCTAIINGDLTLTVTPLYIGPKLVVVEIFGRHCSYSVNLIKLLPLDDKYSNWVQDALQVVKEKVQGPTTMIDHNILATVYTAMKEGRLDVPSF